MSTLEERLKSDDRTPDMQSFNEDRTNLDVFTEEIYTDLSIGDLSLDSMKRILVYMGKRYSQPWNKELLQKGIVPFGYDVGYLMFKNETFRLLDMPDEQKTLLLDAVYGWLYYNPGFTHEEERDRCVREYIQIYGEKSLKKYLSEVKKHFCDLIRRADMAIDDLRTPVLGEPGEWQLYNYPEYTAMFVQFAKLGERMWSHIEKYLTNS